MKIETVGLVYMLLLRNISDYILQKLSHVTLDFKFKTKKKEKGKNSSFIFECLLNHLIQSSAAKQRKTNPDGLSSIWITYKQQAV